MPINLDYTMRKTSLVLRMTLAIWAYFWAAMVTVGAMQESQSACGYGKCFLQSWSMK